MSFSSACPICGRFYSDDHSSIHRCPQTVLDTIDAAHEYAWDAEIFPSVIPVSEYNPIPYSFRLHVGFWIMNPDDY